MIALVLALVMAAAFLTACGGSGVQLADVQKAGKLVIATSPDFPPFENLENGEVVGIEIDIMNLICKEMGVELNRAKMEKVLAEIVTGPDMEHIPYPIDKDMIYRGMEIVEAL